MCIARPSNVVVRAVTKADPEDSAHEHQKSRPNLPRLQSFRVHGTEKDIRLRHPIHRIPIVLHLGDGTPSTGENLHPASAGYITACSANVIPH
jgi:hypothetical protein